MLFQELLGEINFYNRKPDDSNTCDKQPIEIYDVVFVIDEKECLTENQKAVKLSENIYLIGDIDDDISNLSYYTTYEIKENEPYIKCRDVKLSKTYNILRHPTQDIQFRIYNMCSSYGHEKNHKLYYTPDNNPETISYYIKKIATSGGYSKISFTDKKDVLITINSKNIEDIKDAVKMQTGITDYSIKNRWFISCCETNSKNCKISFLFSMGSEEFLNYNCTSLLLKSIVPECEQILPVLNLGKRNKDKIDTYQDYFLIAAIGGLFVAIGGVIAMGCIIASKR